MNDGADVAFVDSHAKGTGTAENGGLVGKEPLLRGSFFFFGEASVIKLYLISRENLSEKSSGGFGLGSGATKDNHGALFLGGQPQSHFFFYAGIYYRIVDVLAVRGAFHQVRWLACKEDFCNTLQYWR